MVPRSKAGSKERRDVDSWERAALIRTLARKTKRQLRFFQEVFQYLRREAAGAGLLAEIGHHLF
jgi:hypothetical protein